MRNLLYISVLILLSIVFVHGEEYSHESIEGILNAEIPPPPIRNRNRFHTEDSPVALLSVVSTEGVDASASLDARVAGEVSLALSDSVIEGASVEDTVTAAGQLTAQEQALVDRTIPIPKTNIPSDPARPIEWTSPPTRDTLTKKLGPRGYPWPEKLQNALNTVSSVANQKIGQIKRHLKWKKQADKLVGELSLKKSKVASHVASLTAQIKGLLKKKKQIQNKQLQDKLVERLEVTHANLKKVRRWNHNVRKNQADMIHHKEELAHALEGIKRSLAILKGMKRQRQFPDRGAAQKLKDELSKFDPDLSFEAEADEVRRLQFPDAVLQEQDADAYTLDAIA